MHPSSWIQKTLLLILALSLWQCAPADKQDVPKGLQDIITGSEQIVGKGKYLDSPCVTAGDRLYMVGHQNGQFPDLGWHVEGEMGGIWDHPIKLMDGFSAKILQGDDSYCLMKADSFVNYPFANKQVYNVDDLDLMVDRFQFVPDGKEAIVIEYLLQNQGDEALEISLAFEGVSDLRPVWLGERTGMIDAPDTIIWNEAHQGWLAKDQDNEWYVLFGSDRAPNAKSDTKDLRICDYQSIGQGRQGGLAYNLSIPPRSNLSLPIYIAGSYQSRDQAEATYAEVKAGHKSMLQAKMERYQEIEALGRLTIPDKNMEQAFRWLKYNTDWLIRDVPEVGRGIAAGLPDYPWWFGVDSEYALQGIIATGQRDLVYSTIDLLVEMSSKNEDNRIMHEVSTNGVIFNPGNINETPQFVSLIWNIYQWTGDLDFLSSYYPVIKNGLEWLLEANDADGNLIADGFGMMEIHGLDSEMIDVAAYSQKAFAEAAEIARIKYDTILANEYQQIADELKQRINEEFWVPAFDSYADFMGTTGQAKHLIDDAIVRADTLGKPWAVEELRATKEAISQYAAEEKRGFVVHHNWVVNTPMEVGIADPDKAVVALETGKQFTNPFGMFVTGIDRDETAGQDVSSFAEDKEIFSYVGAVMTLPTGVQAIAENNYGRPDQALDYLERMTRSFSYALPGGMYEVSPDFGMMVQAWNMYSFAVPIFNQFFGVKPLAPQKRIVISPQMPTDWPEASIEKVLVGDNSLDMSYQKTAEGISLDLTQTKEDWTLEITFPEGKYKEWTVNGEEVEPKLKDGRAYLELSGLKNKVVLR